MFVLRHKKQFIILWFSLTSLLFSSFFPLRLCDLAAWR
jgi:hypothetical protein